MNGAIGSEVTYSSDTPSGNGYSLEFDGAGAWNSVDDRVDVPQVYSASEQPFRYYPGDSVTVEAWVKPDSTSGQRIVWDDYGNPSVLLTVLNGGVQFGVSTTTNGPAQGSLGAGAYGGTIEVGKWQHIAGVYDGNEVRVCVDGEKKGGFSEPVTNGVLNQVKAGAGVPVKFGLGANLGLDIFAAGYPTSRKITCDSQQVIDPIEETVAVSSSGLKYDSASAQYIYNWKTDKAWSSTCRQLIIKLKDGSEHPINFKFK